MYKTTTRLQNMGLYNMEDRRGKIIEYVRANSRCTKTEVIKDMEKRSIGSIKTIHPIIIDLLNEGILLVLKNRPNSQIHRLIINDKNEFNQIDETLSEIDNFIDKMDETVHSVLNGISKKSTHTSYAHLQELKWLNLSFLIPYDDAINLILQELLTRINDKIHSETDSQILYTKIVQALRKFTLQRWNLAVRDSSKRLDIFSDALKNVKSSHFTEAKNINVELAGDLATFIQKFKDEFLSES
jgi:hypothetical protein